MIGEIGFRETLREAISGAGAFRLECIGFSKKKSHREIRTAFYILACLHFLETRVAAGGATSTS